jgi:SAM-dependent methyltransferase
VKISQVYDEILADFDSTLELYKKIEPDLNEPILECACGSGDLLYVLQQKYLSFGLDNDPEMLKLAKLKGCRNLIMMDMTKLEFKQTFETILCFGDSINYLSKDDLLSFFAGVKKSLSNHGLFIFDIHHISRLQEFEDPYIEEADMGEYQYQWMIQTYENQLVHQFVFYIQDDTIVETVMQTVYSEQEIEEILASIGLVITNKSTDEDLEKVMYWCKKEGL